ncbi:MAG TPA: hypothetical protein VFO55_07170 [Gemmatimonadaceae bacterium]|nr:hypothetical protein [Gemmatimonadaceae bacterium]
MRRIIIAGIVALAIARPAAAQQAAASTPPFDFSGLVFGSYGLRTDSAAKAALGGQMPNQFGIDRVYLTFRMPAGDNGQVRVTTDVFQNTNNATNGYYQGWAIRIKYAYFQYSGLKDFMGEGSSLTGRVGALHNVIIEQTDPFWPRYLQQNGVERTGFFSSADVGVAGLLTLGNKLGEVYGTVTNGPGYTSFDRDRFKDFAIRATLTPFAQSSGNTYLKSLAVTPWYYRGALASAFAAGGANQTGPGTNGAVTDALTRDRYGIFAGVRDRRFSLGVELAQRVDQSEAGSNTAAVPRVVTDSTGRLLAAYTVARPLEWLDGARRSPLSLIARYDRFTPHTDPGSVNYAGTTPSYDYTLFGAAYDVNQRITLALDWQTNTPKGFPPATGTNIRPTPRQSTVFLHWQATF